jgi:hypothetical protein
VTWYTPNIHGEALNQSRSLIAVIVLILFVGLLVGLAWGNYIFSDKNISGEGFLVQWIGIHSLVTVGNSPYSNLVTAQIRETIKYQNSFTEGTPPSYTSPLFSGLIVFPFALIDNKILAHALWLTTQLIAIFIILIVGLKITDWKPAWYIFLLFSLFTTFSYHVFTPWLDGGLYIWAALFLTATFLAIRNNRNEVGGIFLALAAIQPQMTILVIIFTLLWGASKRNKLLILWFFITLISLSIIGSFLVPNWIMQYLQLIYNFSDNMPPGNLGMLFMDLWPGLGKQLGWMLTGVLGIILLLEWWLARKKDFRWFLWTACLTMVISLWIGIPVIPGNFAGLILPLILVSAMLTERWRRGGQWMAVLMAVVLFVWEWSILLNDFTSTQPGMQLNLLIPLPLILIIGLYWVRWWAIKPERLLIEEIRLGETY